MLLQDIQKIKNTKEDLRKFGITLGIFFGLIGGFMLWRKSDSYPIFFAISLFLLVGGFLLPTFLRPLQKGWMTLAFLMGWVMTQVILCLLFYLVVTPIGFIAKLFKHYFLDLEWKEAKESYWISRPERPYNRTQYENQF